MKKARLKFKRWHRKGSIFDFFFIIMILLMFGVCLFVAHLIISTANNTHIFTNEDPSGKAQAAVDTTVNTILNFDNMILFVLVGLLLFVIISATMVFNHPAFFIFSFFLLCIAIMFSAITANTFYDFSQTSQIAATAALFPKVNFIMQNLPMEILVAGIIVSIAMYWGYRNQ